MFRAPLLSIHDAPSLMNGYEDMNIFLIPSIESDVEGTLFFSVNKNSINQIFDYSDFN